MFTPPGLYDKEGIYRRFIVCIILIISSIVSAGDLWKSSLKRDCTIITNN